MCNCDVAIEYVDTIIYDQEVDDGVIGQEIYECPACGEQTRLPFRFDDEEEL